jgi:phytoene/squalene synthetase
MTRNDDRRDDESAGDVARQRPPRVVSLLGQKAEPGERPPRGDSSGPDPLRSAHSTFRDLEPPREDFDPDKARALCAQIARDVLRDLAPALVLLPAPTRLRAQALIAYARTVLDFARDRSLEGERLAQINRLEFELDAALGSEPSGQPVFVQLAALERVQPWPREAFDEIASIARSRVTLGFPANARTADAQRHRLARAALRAMLGVAASAELEALGAAILRAASLLGWRESLWHDRPDLGLRAEGESSARFRDVAAAEARAAMADLAEAEGGVSALPVPFRPAARYATLAAAALARQAQARPGQASPPRLSALTRLQLLLRARVGR